MSSKRRASVQKSNDRAKVAKKSASSSRRQSAESSAPATVERVLVSEEVDSVVIPSIEPFPEHLKLTSAPVSPPTNTTRASARPVSAIAARRKAREAAALAAEKAQANEAVESEQTVLEPVELEAIEQDESVMTEAIAAASEEGSTQPNSSPYISDELDGGIVKNTNSARFSQRRKKNKGQGQGQVLSQPVDQGVMSNFEATPENTVSFEMNKETCLAIGLKNNESIVFDGKALIAPFRGAVSIMGASLVASDSPERLTFFPVFSHRTHALLRITPTDKSQSIIRTGGIIDNLNEENLSLLTNMSSNKSIRSIIVVRSLDFCGLDDIDGVFTLTKGLFKPMHPSPGPLLEQISGFFPVFNLQPGLRAIQIPASWDGSINDAIKDAESSKTISVSLVCGAKDIGKSTFVRYLVNRLLNTHQKVAYLETDIGQSEFTPYGMVALHVLDSPILGPPYTHQYLSPKRSHFFGAITPRDNPSYYLRCIHQLIDAWRQEINDGPETNQIPLVINTQGWIKGLGYDLMLDIIRNSAVTDVFAMQSLQSFPPTFENDVKSTGEPTNQQQKHVNLRYINSVQRIIPVAKFVPYDLRVLSMVSYLYQDMAQYGKTNERWWNFQSCLVERVPWALDWRKGLNGIWLLWDDVKLSQLLYSLNGSLVALITDDVTVEPSAVVQNTESIVPPVYLPPSVHPPPDPSTSSCVGLALVRAIDPSTHTFLLLTPLSPAKLKRVTGMVKGDIELPLCCMLDQRQNHGGGVARVPWSRVPYITEKVVEGLGGNALQIRRVNRRARNQSSPA